MECQGDLFLKQSDATESVIIERNTSRTKEKLHFKRSKRIR